MKKIEIVQSVLGANQATAEKNRSTLEQNGCVAVNVMSAPGAGKTSIILATMERLNGIRTGVMEGDVASKVDAEKVADAADAIVQINTRHLPESCALVADVVGEALDRLPLQDLDVLLIENVGNLICPSEFDLGEQLKVLIASTPEGDDKPIKYPMVFADADAIIINKSDLLPYVDFDVDKFMGSVRDLNPDVPFFLVSCKTGEGLQEWADWLRSHIS